ncbi:CBS domain containing-hemolysin-like protein [Knoellia remsis]|uniref:CBS domain containing-hemolysin-like protein n=1 Tax=Knoellia remsis TaxID=407159 RepID=A0A2T0V0M3_9MICO|nr:hemolysin family protein [Knoellia remsis]PRY63706.1 CBS domain containing-hemolysin-like protein [Knoellia remsis]
MTQLVIISLLGLVLAFALSAAEASLQRTSRVRAQELLEEGRAGSRSLVTVVGDSAAYLSVVSFVRVIAEMTTAVLVTIAVHRTLDGTWTPLLVSIGILAVLSFALVGVSPRTLGNQHSTRVALLAAPVAIGLRRVLGPFAKLLVVLANAVTPGKGYRDGPFESESELRDLVDLAGESSLIEAGERQMIHSVFELGDTLAREVMVPRTDMVTIDSDRVAKQAMNLFLRSGYSRIPVTGEDSDDVLGLLYFKDVVRRVNAGGPATPVTEIMRPMPFIPESKPVDALLREMQRDQTHFALVIDEWGGTAGLVTIEDIIEEIVGEIADEYDRETPDIEDLGDGRWRVDATMDIDDLADHLDVSIEEDEVDTVGGLIGKTIGRVPILGSTCEVAGLRLTAERMAGRRHRIATVLVERVEPGDDDHEAAPTGEHDTGESRDSREPSRGREPVETGSRRE